MLSGREELDEVSHMQPISIEKPNPLLDRPGDLSALEQLVPIDTAPGTLTEAEEHLYEVLVLEKENGATIAAVEETGLLCQSARFQGRVLERHTR
jgi:hypothetical protein